MAAAAPVLGDKHLSNRDRDRLMASLMKICGDRGSGVTTTLIDGVITRSWPSERSIAEGVGGFLPRVLSLGEASDSIGSAPEIDPVDRARAITVMEKAHLENISPIDASKIINYQAALKILQGGQRDPEAIACLAAFDIAYQKEIDRVTREIESIPDDEIAGLFTGAGFRFDLPDDALFSKQKVLKKCRELLIETHAKIVNIDPDTDANATRVILTSPRESYHLRLVVVRSQQEMGMISQMWMDRVATQVAQNPRSASEYNAYLLPLRASQPAIYAKCLVAQYTNSPATLSPTSLTAGDKEAIITAIRHEALIRQSEIANDQPNFQFPDGQLPAFLARMMATVKPLECITQPNLRIFDSQRVRDALFILDASGNKSADAESIINAEFEKLRFELIKTAISIKKISDEDICQIFTTIGFEFSLQEGDERSQKSIVKKFRDILFLAQANEAIASCFPERDSTQAQLLRPIFTYLGDIDVFLQHGYYLTKDQSAPMSILDCLEGVELDTLEDNDWIFIQADRLKKSQIEAGDLYKALLEKSKPTPSAPVSLEKYRALKARLLEQCSPSAPATADLNSLFTEDDALIASLNQSGPARVGGVRGAMQPEDHTRLLEGALAPLPSIPPVECTDIMGDDLVVAASLFSSVPDPDTLVQIKAEFQKFKERMSAVAQQIDAMSDDRILMLLSAAGHSIPKSDTLSVCKMEVAPTLATLDAVFKNGPVTTHSAYIQIQSAAPDSPDTLYYASKDPQEVRQVACTPEQWSAMNTLISPDLNSSQEITRQKATVDQLESIDPNRLTQKKWIQNFKFCLFSHYFSNAKGKGDNGSDRAKIFGLFWQLCPITGVTSDRLMDFFLHPDREETYVLQRLDTAPAAREAKLKGHYCIHADQLYYFHLELGNRTEISVDPEGIQKLQAKLSPPSKRTELTQTEVEDLIVSKSNPRRVTTMLEYKLKNAFGDLEEIFQCLSNESSVAKFKTKYLIALGLLSGEKAKNFAMYYVSAMQKADSPIYKSMTRQATWSSITLPNGTSVATEHGQIMDAIADKMQSIKLTVPSEKKKAEVVASYQAIKAVQPQKKWYASFALAAGAVIGGAITVSLVGAGIVSGVLPIIGAAVALVCGIGWAFKKGWEKSAADLPAPVVVPAARATAAAGAAPTTAAVRPAAAAAAVTPVSYTGPPEQKSGDQLYTRFLTLMETLFPEDASAAKPALCVFMKENQRNSAVMRRVLRVLESTTSNDAATLEQALRAGREALPADTAASGTTAAPIPASNAELPNLVGSAASAGSGLDSVSSAQGAALPPVTPPRTPRISAGSPPPTDLAPALNCPGAVSAGSVGSGGPEQLLPLALAFGAGVLSETPAAAAAAAAAKAAAAAAAAAAAVPNGTGTTDLVR